MNLKSDGGEAGVKGLRAGFYERILLPAADTLSRQCVMEQYRFYDQAQWWDRGRLVEFQNRRLRETVRIAYEETPFYRDLFDGNNLRPDDIATVEDLEKLPVVTKDMIREAYPGRCTRANGRPYKEFHTSGSTGRPFVVRVDNYSLSVARALMLLRTTYSGWRIGDGSFQTGMTLHRGIVKKLKDIVLGTTYVSAFDLSDEVLDGYLRIIEDRKHLYMMGYAASMYLIARRAEEVGFNHALKGIISWGDMMFPKYRELIERQFKCRVTDSYGCGEGIQMGAQCGSAGSSYHLFMPHVAVEFTNGGRRVEPGERGEILLTRLDPGAMPLIRYSVGDMGVEDPAQACPCGRGFSLMKSVDGRAADIVVTPSGNRLIVHFFTGIFEYAGTIDTFQVVQERPGEINVKIVVKRDFQMSDWEALKKEMLEKGDRELKISMEIVDEIPLEKSNKRRFVVSRVPMTPERRGESI